MTLNRLRKEIDRIDLHLLKLLNRRAVFAQRIGGLKEEKGLPIFDGKREDSVLRRMIRANPGPLSTAAVRGIFREILSHNRRLQKKGSRRSE